MNSHLTNADRLVIADRLIFTPDDVDLTRSPLRAGLADHGGVTEKTFVLGAFNPGLCRLPNGNLLLMVRIAEALTAPVHDDRIHCIRWDAERNFTTAGWPLSEVEITDSAEVQDKSLSFSGVCVNLLVLAPAGRAKRRWFSCQTSSL